MGESSVAATLAAGETSDVVHTGSAPEDARAAAYFAPQAAAHYDVRGEVASGGMGRILEAWDNRFERLVALKVLLRADGKALRRFAREASITARLEHPAIVPMHEAGRLATGEPFYAMKLVRGRSLREASDEARTAKDRLALLPHLVAVADALAYAHDRRIIHRDLKPSNVLCGSFGETVLIDWGLAKDLSRDDSLDDGPRGHADAMAGAETPIDPLTLDGATLGTPSYMPPEQARGESVDERADVYALGAVLYQVLSGCPPHGAASPGSGVHAPPPPIAAVAPDLPRDLVAVVAKAMAREASDRYPTARELAEDLRRFTTGQLVSAHTYSLQALLARWGRRHRLTLSVALALVVAFLALGVAGVGRIVRERDRADVAKGVADGARAQEESHRKAAESLVDFVLVTLGERVKALGHLDLMEGVGEEVDRYYQQVAPTDDALDVPTLDRRAAAIEAMAEVEGTKHDLERVRALWSTAASWRERAHRMAPDDVTALKGLVRDEFSLTQLAFDNGALDEAEAHIERARALCAPQLERGPTRDLLDLSVHVDKLAAALLSERGHANEALQVLRPAIVRAREVVTAEPENADWLGLLWYLDCDEAVYENNRGGFPEAVKPAHEAIELMERLVRLAPDDTRKSRSLAWAWSIASVSESGLHDWSAARADQLAARAIRQRLIQVEPANKEILRDLMDSENSLSAIALAEGDDREALARGRGAMEIADRAWRETPDASIRIDDLLETQTSVIDALLANGQAAEARAVAEPGIALAVKNTDWPKLLERWVRLGRADVALGALAKANEDRARAADVLPKLDAGNTYKTGPLKVQLLAAEIALAERDLDAAARDVVTAFDAIAGLPAEAADIDVRVMTVSLAWRIARSCRGAGKALEGIEKRARALVEPYRSAGTLSVQEQRALRSAGYP